MAALPTESLSSSPARQAIFAQEKLERIYVKTHGYLRPFKNAIELVQDVLVWKKPLVSALLYVVVHWLFITYVNSTATLVTVAGNVMFWGLVGDILWRAATKDGFSGPATQEGGRRGRGSRGVERVGVAPRLESVLIQKHRPRGQGELPSFEIVCLWVSEAAMWLDNILLAFRHWSINEPVIFTIGLALPGLVMSLMGMYIPTTVFLYLQVITLLVIPYVEHHCLRQRALSYISAQYPGVLKKAKSLWNFLKNITVNRDRSEDPELSLAQGVGELRTQVSLQEAFELATAKPPPQTQVKDELELEPEVPSNRGGGPEIEVTASPSVTEQNPAQSGERPTVPHPHEGTAPYSTSLDSLTLDSFVGGHDDFPSITDLDNSLALPQFPSGDYSIMPTISEEEEPSRPQNSNQEFDTSDFLDGRSTQLRPQPFHPLAQTHRADPISTQPSAPPRTSGFESLGYSMYTTPANAGQTGQTSQQQGYPSNFVPPPTYQQVEAGSPDAGVTVDWTPGPNSSSTPNVQEEDDSWGAKKRLSGTY